MSCERISRDQLAIHDTPVVFADWPIHFAGAALFCRNDNNNAVVLSLQDSNDGVTWNVLLFSDVNSAGLINVTIAEQSFVAILFTTCRKYIRFTVAGQKAGDVVNAGVFGSLCQYPPKGRECPDVS